MSDLLAIDLWTAQDHALLKREGITHVVNLIAHKVIKTRDITYKLSGDDGNSGKRQAEFKDVTSAQTVREESSLFRSGLDQLTKVKAVRPRSYHCKFKNHPSLAVVLPKSSCF